MPEGLGKINVTAWLYLDDRGDRQVKVNPNITLKQIREEFDKHPLATPRPAYTLRGLQPSSLRTTHGIAC